MHAHAGDLRTLLDAAFAVPQNVPDWSDVVRRAEAPELALAVAAVADRRVARSPRPARTCADRHSAAAAARLSAAAGESLGWGTRGL